jgi:hypothetical protein
MLNNAMSARLLPGLYPYSIATPTSSQDYLHCKPFLQDLQNRTYIPANWNVTHLFPHEPLLTNPVLSFLVPLITQAPQERQCPVQMRKKKEAENVQQAKCRPSQPTRSVL